MTVDVIALLDQLPRRDEGLEQHAVLAQLADEGDDQGDEGDDENDAQRGGEQRAGVFSEPRQQSAPRQARPRGFGEPCASLGRRLKNGCSESFPICSIRRPGMKSGRLSRMDFPPYWTQRRTISIATRSLRAQPRGLPSVGPVRVSSHGCEPGSPRPVHAGPRASAILRAPRSHLSHERRPPPPRPRARLRRLCRHPRRRRAPARRRARPLGRGDYPIHARERPDGAPVSRRERGQDHRQPHLPRRLAPGELRRDGHGAPARAHDVQGHLGDLRSQGGAHASAGCASTRRPRTTAPTTTRRSTRRPQTSSGRSRWKRTGWSTRRSLARISTAR